MKLILTQNFTLDSSTVTEAAYSEWVVGSTYATGNKVYVTLSEDTATEVTPHKIYESLADANTGNYPPDDSTNWLDSGATNRWAMFDNYVSSQTENASSIVVVLTPDDRVDTLALFNLDATGITVVCKANTVEVFNETYDLERSDAIGDLFDYFFGPFEFLTELTIPVLGLYPFLEITLTITKAGTAKCGHCVAGLSQTLGNTKYSPKISIADYSTKSTNTFGETYLNQKAYAKTIDIGLTLKTSALDGVAKKLSAVRSTPCVWESNNPGTEYTSLIVYGFLKEFDLLLQNLNISECNLSIEGLI